MIDNDATPRLRLPFLASAQAQKHVTLNESLGRLDALVQASAESRTLAAQPSAPAEGALYILPAAATGADWSGQAAGVLMRFDAGAWTALQPEAGWLAHVRDEGALCLYDGAQWGTLAQTISRLQNLLQLGVGGEADAGNPLTVRGPAALFAAEDGGAGDFRLKVDKAATAGVASVLFQTGWSGRAEIGLTGDDALHLRASSDGASWTDGVVVDAAAGEVRVLDGLQVKVMGAEHRVSATSSVRVGAATVASLPSASAHGAGAILFVSDESGGATLAFSDGTAWRRTADRAVVS